MSIHVGRDKAVLCRGEYRPAALYEGREFIGGARRCEPVTVPGSIEGTYNDAVELSALGRGWQNGTPTPDNPVPLIPSGATMQASTNMFDVDTMSISNSVVNSDGSLTLLDETYDRILGMKSWVPKQSAKYTVIIDVLENSFNSNMRILTDERFYFNGNQLLNIDSGVTGCFSFAVSTRGDFSAVSLGSLWFQSVKEAKGIFRCKLAIMEGTCNINYVPQYSSPTQIQLPILRGIPDGNGGWAARDRLIPVAHQPGWYDLVKNVFVFDTTFSAMNNAEDYPGWIKTGISAAVGLGFNNEIKQSTPNITNVGLSPRANTLGNDIIFVPKSILGNMSQSEIIAKYGDTPFVLWAKLKNTTTERVYLGPLKSAPGITTLTMDGDYPPDVTATALVAK